MTTIENQPCHHENDLNVLQETVAKRGNFAFLQLGGFAKPIFMTGKALLLLPSATQRSALAVVGRAGPALDRETPHARNLLENAARTHHPLHAVLGGFAVPRHLALFVALTLLLIVDNSSLTKLQEFFCILIDVGHKLAVFLRQWVG